MGESLSGARRARPIKKEKGCRGEVPVSPPKMLTNIIGLKGTSREKRCFAGGDLIIRGLTE